METLSSGPTKVLPSAVLQNCLHSIQEVGGTPSEPHHAYGFVTGDILPSLPGLEVLLGYYTKLLRGSSNSNFAAYIQEVLKQYPFQ